MSQAADIIGSEASKGSTHLLMSPTNTMMVMGVIMTGRFRPGKQKGEKRREGKKRELREPKKIHLESSPWTIRKAFAVGHGGLSPLLRVRGDVLSPSLNTHEARIAL